MTTPLPPETIEQLRRLCAHAPDCNYCLGFASVYHAQLTALLNERDSLVAENERLRAANTWERMDEPQTQHLRLCTASYISGIEHRIIYCGLDEGHDGPHRVPATNGGEDERGNAA
jgi:hypothetical protein